MEKKFSNNIKNMKPKKNSKYHQGMLDPKSLVKYFTSCKNEPIIYRSGLEYQFIMFCESNSKIKRTNGIDYSKAINDERDVIEEGEN